MAMRALIHIGMPKTGSTSIQDTLYQRDLGQYLYMPWEGANHGQLVVLLFDEDARNDRMNKRRGYTAGEVEQRRAQWTQKFNQACKSASHSHILISAEVLSSPRRHSIITSLAKTLEQRGIQAEVLAYIRQPVSFMQSAFQQRVKAERAKFHIGPLWPKYRLRFEHIDDLFGRSNVTLVPFVKDKLLHGNVVLDFAGRLGIELDAADIVHANESLSVRALALLYIQRQLGHGYVSGSNDAVMAYKMFRLALGEIGGEKLSFPRSMLEPVIEANRPDLNWINDRLGMDMLDQPNSDSPAQIASEQEILDLARATGAQLEDLLIDAIRNCPIELGSSRLLRNLELLRQVYVPSTGIGAQKSGRRGKHAGD